MVAAVELSEERLRAGTETVETGRVRLTKHVVTSQQTITVPVERVSLDTAAVRENREVNGAVRREEVEIDDGTKRPRR
jgi:stress response protein YsnF